MRPIELRTRRMKRWKHPFGVRYHGWTRFPRHILQDLLRPSTWKKHPSPFAKTERGRQRRQERLFVESRKCGFGCD
ncbi:hypothetical protein [uncultured Methylobacterium sp.]|uniref:hypothetical protein n=1 Tax=uncultured Methylobacterium sp. TaxID=157278 RepID=UPI002626AEA1|nr:hypothetical protein [uncultured Methylobacterium sp.]